MTRPTAAEAEIRARHEAHNKYFTDSVHGTFLAAHEDRAALLSILDAREVVTAYPEKINDDLLAILGRPNFACMSIANALRKSGEEIPGKAEAEQAHTIHFLLRLYLTHGSNWADIGAQKLNEMKTASEPANQEKA